jgi:sulfur-oxidizing protein SoxY
MTGTPTDDSIDSTRRFLLGGLAASVVLVAMPVSADDALVAEAIQQNFGDVPRNDGRVIMVLPPLAESGNTVPIQISVESPMSETDRVKRVVILATRNPRALVATMEFGPGAPRAQFSTNMRLSGTQDVITIAEMSDGSLWQAQSRVLVTVGACDTLQIRY